MKFNEEQERRINEIKKQISLQDEYNENIIRYTFNNKKLSNNLGFIDLLFLITMIIIMIVLFILL